jgi:hypothetical protein
MTHWQALLYFAAAEQQQQHALHTAWAWGQYAGRSSQMGTIAMQQLHLENN